MPFLCWFICSFVFLLIFIYLLIFACLVKGILDMLLQFMIQCFLSLLHFNCIFCVTCILSFYYIVSGSLYLNIMIMYNRIQSRVILSKFQVQLFSFYPQMIDKFIGSLYTITFANHSNQEPHSTPHFTDAIATLLSRLRHQPESRLKSCQHNGIVTSPTNRISLFQFIRCSCLASLHTGDILATKGYTVRGPIFLKWDK